MIRNPLNSMKINIYRPGAVLSIQRTVYFSAILFCLFAIAVCDKLFGANQIPSTIDYADKNGGITIIRNGGDLLRLSLAVWGPNWGWTGLKSQMTGDGAVAKGIINAKIGEANLLLNIEAQQSAPGTLKVNYNLRADKSTELTLFIVELTPANLFSKGSVFIEEKGQTKKINFPFGRGSIGDAVQRLHLVDSVGAETILRFDPPAEITADGAARIVLAKNKIEVGDVKNLAMEIQLPDQVNWYPTIDQIPDDEPMSNWYEWQGTGSGTNCVFDLTNWLDKPAGKHGRIIRRDDVLIYNGKPIKLWGINLCYSACAPEKSLTEKRASLYPRYGINSVRLHKFADGYGWSGIQSKESVVEFDPAGLDRMDYQVAKFKEAGIYVTLSVHFGTIKIGKADHELVPYCDEFGSFGNDNRVSAPHSAFFYSPELQNLHIKQIVNILKHRNPYTGLTYAKDTAVLALEIINEQSIFFYTSMEPLKKSPTMRKYVAERFSDWLKKKYNNHDGLLKAWGDKALDSFVKEGFPAGEHLDKRNILPLGNPWYWDPAQLNGSQAFRKVRLLDTLQFLYELQCEAYDRFVKGTRDAGYDGEIIGSNWQAGKAYSHYANLHTDYRVGLIDRHNYFGGGRGRTFNASSMLARAGSGILSSGLQQVLDRPFMLSEWIHVFPNEWGVEGPAIIAAYGMGLQGWDVSYMFQNGDNATFSKQLGNEWDVMAPQILGIFPAVARQILRGDVDESKTLAVRNVHIPSALQGKLGFDEKVEQGYDNKEFDNAKVPAQAIAVARCVVNFTKDWQETLDFDIKKYIEGDFLVSSTTQLRWKQTNQKTGGYFTINTAATKAVVGFATGESVDLDEITIRPESKFLAIYITPVEKEANFANAKTLLVVGLARARNSGMKFAPSDNELLNKGTSTILMEPVKAEITLRNRKIQQINILDHDGVRTGKTLNYTDNKFILDTSTSKTPYYEVVIR